MWEAWADPPDVLVAIKSRQVKKAEFLGLRRPRPHAPRRQIHLCRYMFRPWLEVTQDTIVSNSRLYSV